MSAILVVAQTNKQVGC